VQVEGQFLDLLETTNVRLPLFQRSTPGNRAVDRSELGTLNPITFTMRRELGQSQPLSGERWAIRIIERG
jgi:hypothetical protein